MRFRRARHGAGGGRLQRRDFNVFVLLGDGEMQEGQVWEAALGAAHHQARHLIAIVDRNGYQLDGTVDDVIGVEPLDEKWRRVRLGSPYCRRP